MPEEHAAEIEHCLPDFVNSRRDKANVGIIHRTLLLRNAQATNMDFWERRQGFPVSVERKSASSGKTGKRSKERVNPNCCSERMRSSPLQVSAESKKTCPFRPSIIQ